MAHVYPSDFRRLWLSGVHTPELETLTRLERDLSADYTVFHGLHWTREWRSGTSFGEIDFLVVNRSGRVLVVEQKNGALVEKDGDLAKHYGATPKSTTGQIQRSVEAVLDKYKRQHHGGPGLQLDYLLYCPDHRLERAEGLSISKDRVVDASSGEGLAGAVVRCLGPGGEDEAQHERVLRFLRGALDLVPDIHALVTSEGRQFQRLNADLLKVVTSLELPQRRLRIQGVAGCGKSQIAIAVAERALKTGRRPLVLCFNRPLREQLRASLPAAAVVQTWYGLCAEFLKAAGDPLDFSGGTPPGFWQDVHRRVIGATVPKNWLFDTVIVDEGQDFEQEWFEILQLFLAPGAEILWLEDPDQNVRGVDPVGQSDPPFVTYHARENFRTPASIARFIREVLPVEFESVSALPGLPVHVETYDDPAEQADMATRLVSDLRRQGFEPDDIVLLSCHGVDHSPLWQEDRIAGMPIRRFTGEYDSETSEQLFTEGKLLLETVYRFKGQQAPAVILCDVDGPSSEAMADQYAQLLYTGMTRSTVALHVLANAALNAADAMQAAAAS